MIEYIHEPTDLQCGQAVLAMVLGKTVDEIVTFLQNDRETTLAEMKKTFREHGVHISDERIAVQKKEQLPVKSNMVYTLCKHMVYMLSITNEHKNELEMRAKPEWKVHFLCFASAKRGSFSIR